MSQSFLLTSLIFVINLFLLILFFRVMLSWLPFPATEKMMRFLGEITDPLLKPIQKVIPPLAGMDLSPMILFLALTFLEQLLESIL